MEHQAFLATVSEIAAYIGFTGVIAAFRHGTQRWTLLEMKVLSTMLRAAISARFMSLIPCLLQHFFSNTGSHVANRGRACRDDHSLEPLYFESARRNVSTQPPAFLVISAGYPGDGMQFDSGGGFPTGGQDGPDSAGLALVHLDTQFYFPAIGKFRIAGTRNRIIGGQQSGLQTMIR